MTDETLPASGPDRAPGTPGGATPAGAPGTGPGWGQPPAGPAGPGWPTPPAGGASQPGTPAPGEPTPQGAGQGSWPAPPGTPAGWAAPPAPAGPGQAGTPWTQYQNPAQPAPPVPPGAPYWQPQPPPPRRGWGTRRIVAVAGGAFVVLVLLVVGIGVLVGSSNDDDKSTIASSTPPSHPATSPATPAPTSTSTDQPTLDARNYKQGHCYTWDQTGASSSAKDVPCASPHLFESTTSDTVLLTTDYPVGTLYPGDDAWEEINDKYCGPPAEAYLGYKLDPYGRFSATSIGPTEDGWSTGDRDLYCGLQAYVPGGTDQGFDAVVGSAKGVDQSWVYPIGTCLSSSGNSTEVVDCSASHDLLAIGDVTIPNTADGLPPSDDSLSSQATSLCAGAATQHLGASFHQSSSEVVGWFSIRPESWTAGSRTTTCTLNYVTSAGDPRPVTGETHHPA